LTILYILTENPHWETAGLLGKMLTIVLTRPIPLILLAVAIFYLWTYLRRDPDRVATSAPVESGEAPLAPTSS
jgi:hypothetical protein